MNIDTQYMANTEMMSNIPTGYRLEEDTDRREEEGGPQMMAWLWPLLIVGVIAVGAIARRC